MLNTNRHLREGVGNPPGLGRRDLSPSSIERLPSEDSRSIDQNARHAPESPDNENEKSRGMYVRTDEAWSVSLGKRKPSVKKSSKTTSHLKPSNTQRNQLSDSESPSSSGDESSRGVGTASKHTDYTTNKNKKNEKNKKITKSAKKSNPYEIIGEATDESREIGTNSSEEDAYEYEDLENEFSLEDDIEFLISLGREGVKESVIKEDAYHQRTQFENLVQFAPDVFKLEVLNQTSYNQLTLQFDIDNPLGISSNIIRRTIELEADEYFKNLTTDIKLKVEMCKRSESEYEEQCQLHEDVLPLRTDESVFKEYELKARAEEQAKELTQTLNGIVSCVSMKDVRVIQNKAYFPKVMDAISIRSIIDTLGVGLLPEITPNLVKATMESFLINRTFPSVEDPEFCFTTKRNKLNAGLFLYVAVSHLPMRNGEDAQAYYSKNFLTKIGIVKKFVDYELPNNPDMMEAHALIELTLDKMPPRKLTAGQVRASFESDFSQWHYTDEKIKHLQEDLAYYAKADPTGENPEFKRMKIGTKAILSRIGQVKKDQQEVLNKYAAYDDKVYVSDRYEMITRVLYNAKYCSLCNTTSHSFRECKERGCTMCNSRNHPFYKCKFRCKCRRGPIHAEEECPHPVAMPKTKKPQHSLANAREHNHKDNVDFFKKLAEKKAKTEISPQSATSNIHSMSSTSSSEVSSTETNSTQTEISYSPSTEVAAEATTPQTQDSGNRILESKWSDAPTVSCSTQATEPEDSPMSPEPQSNLILDTQDQVPAALNETSNMSSFGTRALFEEHANQSHNNDSNMESADDTDVDVIQHTQAGDGNGAPYDPVAELELELKRQAAPNAGPTQGSDPTNPGSNPGLHH